MSGIQERKRERLYLFLYFYNNCVRIILPMEVRSRNFFRNSRNLGLSPTSSTLLDENKRASPLRTEQKNHAKSVRNIVIRYIPMEIQRCWYFSFVPFKCNRELEIDVQIIPAILCSRANIFSISFPSKYKIQSSRYVSISSRRFHNRIKRTKFFTKHVDELNSSRGYRLMRTCRETADPLS